jgi:large subunit ribosomal protein L10
MPLLKDDKKNLAQEYVEMMESGKNVVVIKHTWIPVNEINEMRMWISESNGNIRIVKKRVLLKWLEGKYDGLSLDMLEGSSIALLTSNNEEDEHAPLKIINKLNKKWKKEKEEFGIEFVWGWYEWAQWRDAWYVSELADLPSKEELIGKFLFMLNHPVSSFARVLKAIADNQWWGEEAVIEEPKEEAPTEESSDSPAEATE